MTRPIQPISRTLLLAMLLAAPSARTQIMHHGPAENIALAKSLSPFDVISIRENNSPLSSWGISIHDDTMTATDVPLDMLIEFAYDVKSDVIFGLTGPVKDKHFDIQAKVLPRDGENAPPKLADNALQAMLITLLADRFHFKAHLQTKTLPVYDLVVLKGGPKLQLSQAERTDNSWNINGEDTKKVLTAKSASMPDLASALADEVHRKVIDKTGLTGAADITLKWTDDAAADSDAPVLSIFTAVEEQLGLKLQPSKGPVETLVIDHVEMPSQN